MFKPVLLLTCGAILLAGVLPAQTPDLATPDVQKLKSDALAQRAEIVRQRNEALRKLIDDQLEGARQGLAKAKVSDNITATASGTAAVKIFTAVKASFEKDGSYLVTGTVRRDLENSVDEFRRNAQAIEERQADAIKGLNKTFAAKLGEVLARQKTPVSDEAKLLDLWTPLLQATTAAAPADVSSTAAATPGTTPAAGPTSTAGTNTAAVLPGASAVLESHGDAANWTPLMKLDATVHDALEVVSVSIAGISAPKSFDGMGGMGNPWQVQATPYQELNPGAATPAFRIQSAPPYKPLEVAAWPDARNAWTIDLRAKTSKIPSRHVVILETDAAACKPLTAGGAPAPTPSPAAPATSTPSATSTPPATTAPSVTTAHSDGSAPMVKARGESPLDVTIPVSAASADWTPTGVRVRKGKQVHVTGSGTWSCGSDGEMVDANGYPNNDTYFKYYTDPLQNPRIFPKGNYGQLIARILPEGEVAAIGRQGTFTAAADGEVALTINEAVNARKDNRGKVSARVMVDP